MKTNKFLLPVIVTIFAAISISSCTVRSHYSPGYDYGYYGPRYYRVPPPPPRVVVVKPAPHRSVIRADRYRSSRSDRRHYQRQYNRGNHYGNRSRTYGPR